VAVLLLLGLAAVATAAWMLLHQSRQTLAITGAPTATFTGTWTPVSGSGVAGKVHSFSGTPPLTLSVLAAQELRVKINKTGPGALQASLVGPQGSGGASLGPQDIGSMNFTGYSAGRAHAAGVLAGSLLLLVIVGALLTWAIRRERRRRAEV
jgi:hypothetical protein